MLEHAPLKAVYIYFDTATYDEIKRDEKVLFWTHLFFGRHIVFMNLLRIYLKVTMEAQLGLIGGTMGLLTGFSILSGVEIIYHLLRFLFSRDKFSFLRFFMSLKIPRADVVSSVRKRFENSLTRKD